MWVSVVDRSGVAVFLNINHIVAVFPAEQNGSLVRLTDGTSLELARGFDQQWFSKRLDYRNG